MADFLDINFPLKKSCSTGTNADFEIGKIVVSPILVFKAFFPAICTVISMCVCLYNIYVSSLLCELFFCTQDQFFLSTSLLTYVHMLERNRIYKKIIRFLNQKIQRNVHLEVTVKQFLSCSKQYDDSLRPYMNLVKT